MKYQQNSQDYLIPDKTTKSDVLGNKSKYGLGDPLIEVLSVDSSLRYFGNADITLLYFMIYKSSKNHFKNLDVQPLPLYQTMI